MGHAEIPWGLKKRYRELSIPQDRIGVYKFERSFECLLPERATWSNGSPSLKSDITRIALKPTKELALGCSVRF